VALTLIVMQCTSIDDLSSTYCGIRNNYHGRILRLGLMDVQQLVREIEYAFIAYAAEPWSHVGLSARTRTGGPRFRAIRFRAPRFRAVLFHADRYGGRYDPQLVKRSSE